MSDKPKDLNTPVTYVTFMTFNETGETAFHHVNMPGHKGYVTALQVKKIANKRVSNMIHFMILGITEFEDWYQLRKFFAVVPMEKSK